jgi:putative ABC transport system ATP-binding protein
VELSGGAHYGLSELSKVRRKGGISFELIVPELRIGRGELIAFVGQSGCGKSTLLDILALVLRPTGAGRFLLRVYTNSHGPPSGAPSELPVKGGPCRPFIPHGEPEADSPPEGVLQDINALDDRALADIRRSQIGYVLQSGGLLPFLTVGENILLTSAMNDCPDQLSTLESLVRRLDIADQLGKKPRHLSGGQRQRVAIARALVHRPPIVVADEPTAAVDRINAREIRRIFVSLAREMRVTFLLASHDKELVSETADRVFTFSVERVDPSSIRSTLMETS